MAHFPAGAVAIRGTALFADGIVRHHRVDVARGNEEAESWASESLEVLAIFVVGLRENSHSEALCLEHAGYNGNAKRRMIDVRITRYVYEIYLRPITRPDVVGVDRKKCCSI